MINRYASPEVVEIGLAQDVILGEKTGPVVFDSMIGQWAPRDINLETSIDE